VVRALSPANLTTASGFLSATILIAGVSVAITQPGAPLPTITITALVNAAE
jgi:hypothetical protein